jgi:hypothetical protein
LEAERSNWRDALLRVVIVYTNGVKVVFNAQEFDIDTSPAVRPGRRNNELRRFEYKDAEGNTTPLYMTPDEVAGVTVVTLDNRGDSALRVS